MKPGRGGLWGLWLLLVFVLGSLGACARPDPSAGPLWTDPGVVRFAPDRIEVEVEIHNRSGTTRPIADISLGGEDWSTLRFVEQDFPRTIPARDSVTIPLAISAAAYRLDAGRFRSGHASLSFSSSAYTYELPIEFVGSDQALARGGPWLSALAALAALLALGLLGAGARRDGPSARTLQLHLGLALAAHATLLASIPLGFGLCRGRLTAALGPRELEQCRAQLGGSALRAFDTSPGLVWTLGLLALAATLAVVFISRSQGPRAAAPVLARAGLRLGLFALLVTSLGFGMGLADTSLESAVLHQGGALAGLPDRSPLHSPLPLPRWGVVAQPLGFLLMLLALALPHPAGSDPGPRTLSRLEDLCWSALIASFFLGGPALPGVSSRPIPLLTHGASIALELLALGAKIALVWILLERLRSFSARFSLGVRQCARVLLPLALVQLAAVIVWRLILP